MRRLSPKCQRLLFVALAVALCAAGVLLILGTFRDNIIFFYTPTELKAHPEALHNTIRVGGLVEAGSVRQQPGTLAFIITDGTTELKARYGGTPPALFREGQGVVAEGKLDGNGTLIASLILAKHDERYMPKSVADQLKKSGRWRGGP